MRGVRLEAALNGAGVQGVDVRHMEDRRYILAEEAQRSEEPAPEEHVTDGRSLDEAHATVVAETQADIAVRSVGAAVMRTDLGD